MLGTPPQILFLRAVLLTATLSVGNTQAMAADTALDAFKESDWNLSFRYRLELVDQEPFNEDATASTIRTRLNYKTADWYGVSLLVEFDHITELFGDDYDEGAGNTPNRGQTPVVADPVGDDWTWIGSRLGPP